VNTLAITDDNQLFITGSKTDYSINVWSTTQIERDITSHSLFSLKTYRAANCITTIENADYFAVGGSSGGIDVY